MTRPRERFFVAQRGFMYGTAVILIDYEFWCEHIAELDAWCQANDARRQGMTVEMDDETYTLFVLRWAA